MYSIMLLFGALISHFFQLGLHQSLLTLYHQQVDNKAKCTLISTTWSTVSINSIILLSLIIIFRKFISGILINSDENFSYILILTSLMVFLDVFCGLTLVLLNIRQQSKQYSILNLTKNIVILLGVGLFSILNMLDMKLFFEIIVFASLVAFFHSLYFFRSIWKELSDDNNCYKKFSLPIFKDIIRFGVFMVPATFAVISLQSADRYMLNLLSPRTLYDAGIYAIAYKIGMIMSLFTVIFDLLFFPYIMKIAKKDYVKTRLDQLYKLYCISATIIAALIILFSREVFILLDDSYQEGAGLVFFGVISMYLRGLSNLLVLGFYIKKSSKKIALASVLAALINILLNWIWIPDYGIMGAGFASIIAYLFIVVFNYITVEKAFYVGYNFLNIVIAISLLTIISLLNYHLVDISLPMFLFKSIIALGLLGVTYLIIKNKEYLKSFKEMLKK